MKPENAPRLTVWVTAPEIAQELGVSRQTVNTMIHNGEFKSLHWQGLEGNKPQWQVRRIELEKIARVREFPRSKSKYELEDSPLPGLTSDE